MNCAALEVSKHHRGGSIKIEGSSLIPLPGWLCYKFPMDQALGKIMKTKKSVPTSLAIFALVCISSLLYNGLLPLSEEYLISQLQQTPLNLQIKPLQQKKITSCGEAAITMAYNYAYPESPVKELDVVAFATEKGYYTDDRPPFTSPEDMVKIAKYYADDVTSGRVTTQERGLELLMQKLRNNEPVIIDVLTRLDDPYSGAHFVLVTGISMDPKNEGVVIIHYNNPLTARNESASWAGDRGVWNAWQNNDDPGGSGWWMVIHAPKWSVIF